MSGSVFFGIPTIHHWNPMKMAIEIVDLPINSMVNSQWKPGRFIEPTHISHTKSWRALPPKSVHFLSLGDLETSSRSPQSSKSAFWFLPRRGSEGVLPSGKPLRNGKPTMKWSFYYKMVDLFIVDLPIENGKLWKDPPFSIGKSTMKWSFPIANC